MSSSVAAGLISQFHGRARRGRPMARKLTGLGALHTAAASNVVIPLFTQRKGYEWCHRIKQGMDLIDLRQILERVIFCMDPFGSLGGHYGLPTASEVKSDLRFGIYGPNLI